MSTMKMPKHPREKSTNAENNKSIYDGSIMKMESKCLKLEDKNHPSKLESKS